MITSSQSLIEKERVGGKNTGRGARRRPGRASMDVANAVVYTQKREEAGVAVLPTPEVNSEETCKGGMSGADKDLLRGGRTVGRGMACRSRENGVGIERVRWKRQTSQSLCTREGERTGTGRRH